MNQIKVKINATWTKFDLKKEKKIGLQVQKHLTEKYKTRP